jgi:hypothetical protein
VQRLRTLTPFLIATSIVIVAWLVFVVGFQDHDHLVTRFSDVLNGEYLSVAYALVPVLAWLIWGPSTIRAWGGTRSYVGRAVLCLGLGLTSWAAGAVVWFYYDTCQMWFGPLDCGAVAKDPYPSLADAFYLGLVPFALVVLHSFARVLGLGKRHVAQFAGCFAVAALASGYWGLPSTTILGLHYGHDYLVFDGASTAELIVGYGYVVSEGLMMSAALVIALNSVRIAGGYLRRPMIVVAACFAFLYFADFLFVWRDSTGDYDANGDFTELLYAAYCLAGAWALREFHVLAARIRGGA